MVFPLTFLLFYFALPIEKVLSPKTTNATNTTTEFNYDLSHPSKKWTLPEDLKEISGQVWLDNCEEVWNNSLWVEGYSAVFSQDLF